MGGGRTGLMGLYPKRTEMKIPRGPEFQRRSQRRSRWVQCSNLCASHSQLVTSQDQKTQTAHHRPGIPNSVLATPGSSTMTYSRQLTSTKQVPITTNRLEASIASSALLVWICSGALCGKSEKDGMERNEERNKGRFRCEVSDGRHAHC